MIDFMLFWGFEDRLTDRLTNERTFVLLESLSRLKMLCDNRFGFYIFNLTEIVRRGIQIEFIWT